MLNRNQLKFIAVAAMTADHIAWAFMEPDTLPAFVMHFIGRITGPLMAYFLYEGYVHTHDKKAYGIRLGLFALISWPAFWFFKYGTFKPGLEFGVIYTLFLGFLAMLYWEKTESEGEKTGRYVTLFVIFYFSLFGDWPIFDVAWPLLLFMYRGNRKKQMQAFWLVSAIAAAYAAASGRYPYSLCNLGIFMAPAAVGYLYSGDPGERRPAGKWFFYVYYPAHLLLIGVIKYCIL